MELHANAALSLNKRRVLCERVLVEGRTLAEAAAAAEVSVRCARKWVGRYLAEGESGLLDRSSAPTRVANRTPEQRVEAIACLRRLRFTGPEIAELLGMALSTVSGILTRIGLGKLGRLGLEPARRYERERPGELVHVDVKKLGRIQRGAGKRVLGRSQRSLRATDALGTSGAGWPWRSCWRIPRLTRPRRTRRTPASASGPATAPAAASPSGAKTVPPRKSRPAAAPASAPISAATTGRGARLVGSGPGGGIAVASPVPGAVLLLQGRSR